ncbi:MULTISPECIES: GNAT family N-acetyltransferase [unclassified Streptomyces]|uniref:GNAT family N-acetyltransferase n=1 Tax=unclassified Streptomyces TaxID=2593676 RepID=UPI00099E6DE5|nr:MULTISPECIES: GNAT family N-acetyltransferase [unclassified Streptomyces]
MSDAAGRDDATGTGDTAGVDDAAGVAAATIRTRRLDLEPLTVAHADEMAEVLSDPALHVFIGGEPLTAPELRARYERLTAGSPDPATVWCNWAVRLREEDRLTGTVQATLTEGGRVAEVAWVTGTEWQGRGIAREAAGGLVTALTERGGVRTVVAHIHPAHEASAAVARSAGLTPTPEQQDGEVRFRLSREDRAVPDRPPVDGEGPRGRAGFSGAEGP